MSNDKSEAGVAAAGSDGPGAVIISGLTEVEESALVAQQTRSKRIWLSALIVVIVIIMSFTIWSIIFAGFVPFENSDVFRSV